MEQAKEGKEMTDDLVKRLRTMAGIGWNPIGDEAADRIEELEFRVCRLEDRIKSVMSYIHLNRGRGRSSDILDGAYDELRRGIK